MRLSVIVPTYNRAPLLRHLLDSLWAQTIGRDAYEVIVVDDGSTDTTPAVLDAACRQSSALRVVRQANLGAAIARNAGVALARGDVLVFIDSDCVADAGWLAAIQASFAEHPDAAGVEGRTVTDRAAVGPFTHQVENLTGGVFATCNMAYRREVLDAAGGFDPAFFYGHEDTELAVRARRIGPLIFAPDAVVTHPPRPISVSQFVMGIRTTVDNERILYLKTRTEYVRWHGCGPVWTLAWRVGVRGFAADLARHAGGLLAAPWTYLRFALALTLQRLILIGMLPGFIAAITRAPERAKGVPDVAIAGVAR